MSLEVLSCRGLRPQCGKVDRDLWLWFCEAQNKYEKHGGPRITKRMVQDHAKQAFQDAGIAGFKASDGWYVRWIKRWRRLGTSTQGQNVKKNNSEDAFSLEQLKKKHMKRSNRNTFHGKSLSAPSEQAGLSQIPTTNHMLDKMQILHDVASREFGQVSEETCPVEHQSSTEENHIRHPSSPLETQISRHEDTTLLDFDQIAWSDLPYLEQSDSQSSTDVQFQIEESSNNYNSSIFSHMTEFAEICNMKDKQMQDVNDRFTQQMEHVPERRHQSQLSHQENQQQVLLHQQHEPYYIQDEIYMQHQEEMLLQQDHMHLEHLDHSIPYSKVGAHSSAFSHVHNDTARPSFIEGLILDGSQACEGHPSVANENGFFVDTMFYSLGEDSFSILDHTSKLEQECISIVVKSRPESSNVSKDSSKHLASVSDYILPNNAVIETTPNSMNASISNSLNDSAPSLYPVHLETDTASSDSTMLLFTQSPFNFNDDSISGLMTLSTSAPSVEAPTEDGPVLASDDLTSGYLQLFDSVVNDSVQEQQVDRAREKPATIFKEMPSSEDGKRKAEHQQSEEQNTRTSRRMGGERYLPYFKERVLSYAAKHTAKEAAKLFGVHVDTVTLWARNKQQNNNVSKPPADQQLLAWLRRNRECDVQVTRSQVRDKARELLQTVGTNQKDKNRWFHVWASRFATEGIGEENTTGPGPVRSHFDYKSESTPTTAPTTNKTSRSSKALYPDDFKLEVVLFAERASQNLAASVFNIARKRVFDWMAAVRAANKMNSGLKENGDAETGRIRGDGASAFAKMVPVASSPDSEGLGRGFGRAVTSVAVDRELWDWFCEQTAKKNKPKSREIREKAVELFRARNYQKIRCSHGWYKKWSVRHGIALRYEGDSDLVAWCLEQFDHNRNISHRDLLNRAYHVLAGTHKSEFKASAGWALRFCKRHRSLLSSRPSVEVELPSVLWRHVSQFRSRVQQLVHSPGMALQNVGAMDEIPLNFTAAGSGGSRGRLLLRRSGLENCHATLVLCCTAEGGLLPPAVIFKGNGAPEQVTAGGTPLLIMHQEEACMDSVTMKHWLNSIWFKKVVAPSILVMDCFDPHGSEAVRQMCRDADCNLALIPPGCSSKLQPLEVTVSRLFESTICARWAKHFATLDNFVMTKRTPYSNNADILQWVGETHAQLQDSKQEAIHCSFLVTGLTVAPNHSEDHFIDNLATVPS